MSDTTDSNGATRPSPATIALTAVGWLELGMSLTLFILELYVVSIAFGLAALLLAWLGNAVLRQRVDYLRQTGRLDELKLIPLQERPGPGRRNFARVLGWAGGLMLGAGIAAIFVGSSVMTALNRDAVPGLVITITFALWGTVLLLLSARLRGGSQGAIEVD
ncbi:MAG: hypothetical protein GYB68_01010 [Chloroflexi bacterium]|nr:hypothetical protein [Chloroflexota bacterium]